MKIDEIGNFSFFVSFIFLPPRNVIRTPRIAATASKTSCNPPDDRAVLIKILQVNFEYALCIEFIIGSAKGEATITFQGNLYSSRLPETKAVPAYFPFHFT